MNERVAATSELMMHMIIRLDDGSIAENTRRNGRPSKVTLGDESISPAFEQELIGLKVGDKKEFKLPASDTFGEHLASNVMTFPRSQFSDDIEVEPNAIIEFQNKNGAQLLGVVQSMQDDQVIVDFNHPLVGCVLQFEVEVLEILN
jgi:FKBP-type peptidyl-prolyl cis-trans isomerase SlpA